MATLNVNAGFLAFNDSAISNNPLLRQFDLAYKLNGVSIQNPICNTLLIPPSASQVLYDGSRTTSISGTTSFDVTRPTASVDIFRFTHNAGTAPAFRTARTTNITTSTVFGLTVNGPTATITVTTVPFSTAAIVVGDILKILPGSGFLAANQGRFTVIGKTPTSISFVNLNALAESVTILDATKFLVYSNGGSTSNQIQIGDSVVISNGFSPSTFGTYTITEVTPSWFEVGISAPNGVMLETAIVPTATGMIFYLANKKFVLISAENKCSVQFNDDTGDNVVVEPLEISNPEKTGIMFKYGNFYKLSVKNLSLVPMRITIATAE